MADKRRLSKPYSSTGKQHAYSSDTRTQRLRCYVCGHTKCIHSNISDGKEWVTMKITGVLVDMLVQLSPEIYGPYIVFEKQWKVIYVQVLKAIYGMLQAALLWYNKFQQELEKDGFEFNAYDPCVGNKPRTDHNTQSDSMWTM